MQVHTHAHTQAKAATLLWSLIKKLATVTCSKQCSSNFLYRSIKRGAAPPNYTNDVNCLSCDEESLSQNSLQVTQEVSSTRDWNRRQIRVLLCLGLSVCVAAILQIKVPRSWCCSLVDSFTLPSTYPLRYSIRKWMLKAFDSSAIFPVRAYEIRPLTL